VGYIESGIGDEGVDNHGRRSRSEIRSEIGKDIGEFADTPITVSLGKYLERYVDGRLQFEN
jgi:hypothetical protein